MSPDIVAADGSNSPSKGNHSKRSRSEPSTEEEYSASRSVDLRRRPIGNSEKSASSVIPTVDNEDAPEPEFKPEPEKKKQVIILEQSEDNFSKNFECSVCGNVFPTHQALGGHKTIHHSKPIRVNPRGEDNNIKSNNTHVCLICGKCFEKGQSLGGHMRCHYKGPIRGGSRKKHQDFDLNISPPARESESELKPKPESELNLELRL